MNYFVIMTSPNLSICPCLVEMPSSRMTHPRRVLETECKAAPCCVQVLLSCRVTHRDMNVKIALLEQHVSNRALLIQWH